MTKQRQQKKKGEKKARQIITDSKIPIMPFDYSEVQSLVSRAASGDLSQRFMIWKASECQTIKQIEETVMKINSSNGNNSRLSKEQRQLKNEYLDRLVSIESDKFRVLSSIMARFSLASSLRPSNS